MEKVKADEGGVSYQRGGETDRQTDRRTRGGGSGTEGEGGGARVSQK